jgi:hypothetical protein
LRKIRLVREDEVIAEFLKSEFYQEEFRQYRELYAELVDHPDLSDERENSIRRALLFRRRGRLWREIPSDVEWWEVELSAEDLKRIRVFARDQWLQVCHSGFSASRYRPKGTRTHPFQLSRFLSANCDRSAQKWLWTRSTDR